jgi:hypothetical protein
MAKGKLTRKCIKKMTDAGLEGKELEHAVDRIKHYLDNENQAGMLGLPQKIQDFVKQTKLELEAEIRNKANIEFLAMSKKKSINARLDSFGDDIIEGFLSLFRGSNRAVTGARLSVDSVNIATLKDLIGGLSNDLEKAGVLTEWASGKRDREVIEAYYKLLNNGEKSGIKEIDEITRILYKWDKETTSRLNSVGAQIELEPGGLFRGSVDSDKVRKATFEGWKEKSRKFFDEEAMRKNLTISYDDHLKRLYEEQVTGRYVIARGAEDSTVPVGFLASNAKLAKKVSRKPRLLFKSGADHHDYIKEFGETGFHGAQSAIYSMEHSSRNFSMMEILGPNPKKLVKDILKERQEKLLSGTDAQTDKLINVLRDTVDGLPRALSDAFKEIDGTTRVPGNVTAAKIGTGLRIAKTLALLGNIVPRSITDFATLISEARFQGMRWGPAVSSHFKAVASAMPNSDAKEFAKLVNIGTESLQSTILNKFGLDQIGSGIGSQLQRFYFKLNGITFWNDTLKSAFALMGASHVGAQSHLPFDKLGKVQRLLDIYGIDKDEWDVMRHTVYEFGKDKNQVITADRIAELPDAVFEALLHRQGAEFDPEATITVFIDEIGDKSALAKVRERDQIEKEAIIQRNVTQTIRQGAASAKAGRKLSKEEQTIQDGDELVKARKSKVDKIQTAKQEVQEEFNKLKALPDAIRTGRLRDEAKDLQGFIDKEEGLKKGVRKSEAIQERVTNRSEEPLSPYGKGLLGMSVNKAKRLLAANELIVEKLERAADLEKQLVKFDTEIANETALMNTAKSEVKELRQARVERLTKSLTRDFEASNKTKTIATTQAGLPHSQFKFSQQAIDKARNDLVEKINVLYQDRNNFAVIIPGAREQAFFNRGSQGGTPWGEAARFFAQFKTFPLAVYTKSIERDILSGGATSIKQGLKEGLPSSLGGGGQGGGDLMGVAGFMAGMSFYGGLGVMATDFFRGRQQRDWETLEPYIESVISGGSFGLYGSTILGHYGAGASYQNGMSAFGPVLGDVPDILSLTAGAFNGDDKAKKALDFLHGYTPTQNVFYMKAIWDYLVFYNLQEMLDPGSLDRMQKSIRNNTGQEFNIPPSDVIPSGGDDPLSIIGNVLQ